MLVRLSVYLESCRLEPHGSFPVAEPQPRGPATPTLTLHRVLGCASRQGLSTELGAFVAGVMLSSTDQQENALHHLENIKSFFISLFIASTGLIMSPRFLMRHMPILALGVVMVVMCKTVLVRRASGDRNG
jgi:predicted Kef-type K+ transport protein